MPIQLKGKRAIKLNNKCFSNALHTRKTDKPDYSPTVQLQCSVYLCSLPRNFAPSLAHSVKFCVYFSLSKTKRKNTKLTSAKRSAAHYSQPNYVILSVNADVVLSISCGQCTAYIELHSFVLSTRFYENAVSTFASNVDLWQWQCQCKIDNMALYPCQHDRQQMLFIY